jgi:tetratricopeptide (TPR) repeat protein
LKNYQQAESDCRHALELDPRLIRACEIVSYVAWQRGDREEAVRITQNGLKYMPHESLLLIEAARMNFEMDKLDEALSVLNIAVEAAPTNDNAYSLRGQILGRQGKYDSAVLDLKRAIELNPQDSESHFNLALTYMFKCELNSALSSVECVLELNPNDGEAFSLFQHLIQELRQEVIKVLRLFDEKFFRYFETGDWEGALKYLKKTVNLNSQQARNELRQLGQAVNNYGFIQNKVGNVDGAERYYYFSVMIHTQLLDVNHPDAAMALYNLGFLLSKQKGDDKRAFGFLAQSLEAWKTIIKTQDQPGYIHYLASCLHTLGEIFAGEKRFDFARQNFEQALGLREAIFPKNHPDIAICLAHLGALYMMMDNIELAWKNLKRAHEIYQVAYGPHHPMTVGVGDTLKQVEQKRKI